MKNYRYLAFIFFLSSCASAIYTVGDRDNPNERFTNILDGYRFYETLKGEKAYAVNIAVDGAYPFYTRSAGYGGFCHERETTYEAIDCALKQCKKNVNGVNAYGGYGSSYKDCALIWVNNENVWQESVKDFDSKKGNALRTSLMNGHNYKIAQQQKKKDLKEAQIQAKLDQQMALWTAYIDQKKSICMSYGFTEENAIATCVQTEINNEIMRMQQVQTYANAQARANAAQRNNALSNMGRCLSTEGNFGACANAWQGYTPPKVTKC